MPFLPSLRGPRRGADFQRPYQPVDEAKTVYDSYVTALALAGGGGTYGDRSRPWPVDRAVTEAYDRVMWVFRCVQVIAGNASRLQARVMDGEAVVEDHPFLRVLNGRANPLETGHQLRKRLVAQILLSKRGAFVEQTVTYGGRVARLDLLPPARTEIVPGRGADLLSHYQVTDINGVKRNVDPEKVLWFRDPHPLDPYSGVTPLESAGLSIELDHFARLYNATFMRNDSRPGGILAVKGTKNDAGAMTDDEMDRIEDRFGRGPRQAGKLTVVSGDLAYVDPAAKPRDVHYPELSRNTKAEILGAFAVPLSMIGDSSDRTYANAEQEEDNFWLIEPMPAMLDLLSAGFDANVDDTLRVGWNTDDIEPVQRAQAKKREEGRTEVDSGLRSIISYAKLAGFADEIESTPNTRALWMPQGRTPIPASEEDADALGLAQPTDSAPSPEAAPPGAPPADSTAADSTAPTAAADADGGAPLVAAEGQPAPGQPTQPVTPAAPAAAAASPGRSAARLLAAARAAGPANTVTPETKAASAPARPGIPAAAPLAVVDDTTGAPRPPRRPARASLAVQPAPAAREWEPGQGMVDALAATLEGVLSAYAERMVGRTAARVASPKARKGTPHYEPEYAQDTRVGTKALDTARIVDEDRWATDAQDAARPYVEAAATQVATRAVDALGDDVDADTRDAVAAAVTAAVAAGVLAFVGASAARQAGKLAEALNVADQAGRSIRFITGIARGWASRMESWARGLAVQAAVAAVEGAGSATVGELVQRGAVPGSLLRRTWMTKMDERVRPTHRAAQGQSVGLGTPFVVGDAFLRYPGDPLAPVEETAGCRCWVRLSVGRDTRTATGTGT